MSMLEFSQIREEKKGINKNKEQRELLTMRYPIPRSFNVFLWPVKEAQYILNN